MIRLAVIALALCVGTAAAEPLAIGIAPSAHLRQSDGWGFAPELLVHTYVPLSADRVYLRPGARVGVRGLVQEDMARDLRIEERDVAVIGELGIVRSGRVVPSVTLLAGLAHRWVTLDAAGVDTSMSSIGGNEWLPLAGAQLGLGMPLHSRVLIEPFVRYEVVLTDARTHLRWGVEASVSLGD